MSREQRSMCWMAAFAVMWVLVELLARFLRNSYSMYQVVWTRYGVHLLFMLAVWGWRDPGTLWRTRRLAFQVARSLLMFAMPAAVIMGITRGVDGDTLWTVFWITPLLIPVFATLWLGERPPVRVWIASGIAVAGAGLLLGPSLPRSPGALFLPLLSAASFSLYVVMTRMLRGESVLVNLFYTALGVFTVLTPVVARSWVTPTRHDFVVLAGIGLLGLGALYALDRMASASAVSSSAPVVALQVALTIGASAVLANRIPGFRAWGGACLVGGAALWTWTRANAVRAAVANP